MVATTPKIPTIKLFTPISLKAFCRYSFIKIGDFKFKIAIHQLIKPFIFKFLAFLREAKSFDNLLCNNKMINLHFFAIDV